MSHFASNDYRPRGHRSYKRTEHGRTQVVKASGPGKAQKLGAAAGGAFATAGGPYKGIKHYAMDQGASRSQATAIGIGGAFIPGGTLAGQALEGYYAHEQGYLNASRYTNKPSTQKAKREGKRAIPAAMNRAIGERGSKKKSKAKAKKKK